MLDIATAEALLSDGDVFRSGVGVETLSDSGLLGGSRPKKVFRFNNIEIEADDSKEWVQPTIEALYSKLRLPPNWDSHGALPIDEQRVADAIKVLSGTMSGNSEVPWVVPTTDGGIQLEWHREGEDLEVEISGTRTASIYFHNANTGEEWEVPLFQNIPRLRELLAQRVAPQPG